MQDEQINLKEEIKLREGPFSGRTVEVSQGQSRLIITNKWISSAGDYSPVLAHEYQRDTKPQFTYAGNRMFQYNEVPADINEPFAAPIDDSAYREGFEDGLQRALTVLYDEQSRSHDKPYAYNALLQSVDAIREIGEAMGFTSSKLYSYLETERVGSQ